jgi:hypothetical protein
MADANVFDHVAGALEAATNLDRLEARGTLRLALKEAGLDARGVRAEEMKVVVGSVLPGELSTRGIEGADALCQQIASSLDGRAFTSDAAGAASPEDVFRRLGGS